MDPVLKVTPERSRIDSPIKITAADLVPGERVTIRTSVMDGALRGWESVVIVDADAAGAVDLCQMSPLEGSTYQGVDGEGPLWSMLGPDRSKFFTRNLPVELEYHSELLRGDSVIASTQFRRHSVMVSNTVRSMSLLLWAHSPIPTMTCRIQASFCCTVLTLSTLLAPPNYSRPKAIPFWPSGGSGLRIVLHTWSTST